MMCVNHRFIICTFIPNMWNILEKMYHISHLCDIFVFHLLTTLHKSDPHCHHHLCHHQSLLLFFILDLKHASSSSLFHRRPYHRYLLDWSHGLLAGPFFSHRFCFSFWFSAKCGRLSIHFRLLSALYKFPFHSFTTLAVGTPMWPHVGVHCGQLS